MTEKDRRSTGLPLWKDLEKTLKHWSAALGGLLKSVRYLEKFSTEEHFTGTYWVTGEKVFRRVIPVNIEGAGTVDQEHGITGNFKIVRMYGMLDHPGTGSVHRPMPLPFAHYVSANAIVLEVVPEKVRLRTGTAYARREGHVVIEYIKA